MRKILGLLLLIIGIGVFIFGNHVASVAAQGEVKVTQAQENEAGSARPVIGPVRRGVRAQVTESSQQKIGQAEQKIGHSRAVANWLHGTGVVLFIIGAGCLITSFSSKKRN